SDLYRRPPQRRRPDRGSRSCTGGGGNHALALVDDADHDQGGRAGSAAVAQEEHQREGRQVNRRAGRIRGPLADRRQAATFCTSATIFFAASPRSFAGTMARPELARMSLPCCTLVPSRRTTSGTERFTSFAAATMPSAMMSQRMMPPKMLTRMPFTAGSLRMILNEIGRASCRERVE